MGNVRQAHPWTNDFVPVYPPVDRATNGADAEQAGNSQHQGQRHNRRPLFPAEPSHDLELTRPSLIHRMQD